MAKGVIIMRKIIIRWSYPRSLKNVYYSDKINDKGLYFITCKFGAHERSLYIGKTIRRFYDRILAHDYNWIHRYRGRKLVRFGIIEYPRRYSLDEMSDIITSVEAALIFEMRDVLIHNKMSKNGYYVPYSCLIQNVGYKGVIPAIVSMDGH